MYAITLRTIFIDSDNSFPKLPIIPTRKWIGSKKNPIALDCIFVIQNVKFSIGSKPSCPAKGMAIGLHLYFGQSFFIFFNPTDTMLNRYIPTNTNIINRARIISLNFILKYIVILFMKLRTAFSAHFFASSLSFFSSARLSSERLSSARLSSTTSSCFSASFFSSTLSSKRIARRSST